jgi:transposase InsO family protein
MKSTQHVKFRLSQPQESTSVDFIVALSKSEGHTQIMVVVDCFSQMAHFIALTKTATARDAAQAFLREVWKLHGIPKLIISDRDTKWTSEFWDELCNLLGIKKRMSMSFYPQTDGQMERVNQTLETYLCSFINYNQDDWYSLLPLAEFAYNNAVTQATKLTPFYTNYGYHAKTIWTSLEESKNPASKAYAH